MKKNAQVDLGLAYTATLYYLTNVYYTIIKPDVKQELKKNLKTEEQKEKDKFSQCQKISKQKTKQVQST